MSETLYSTDPVHKSVGFCALWSVPSTTSSIGPVSWHVFRRRIDARYLMTGRPPPPTQLLKPVFLPPLKPLSGHVRAVITDVRVKPFQPSPPTLTIPRSWLIIGFGINWRIFLYYEVTHTLAWEPSMNLTIVHPCKLHVPIPTWHKARTMPSPLSEVNSLSSLLSLFFPMSLK